MGTPTPDSTFTIRNGANSAGEVGISDEERIRRKRRDLGPLLPPPDGTDAMLLKGASGHVQRYRRQGRKSTFLTPLGEPFGGGTP